MLSQKNGSNWILNPPQAQVKFREQVDHESIKKKNQFFFGQETDHRLIRQEKVTQKKKLTNHFSKVFLMICPIIFSFFFLNSF